MEPVTKVDVIKETSTTAVLDGNNGLGHVVAKQAMQMAIDKAKEHGIVITSYSIHYTKLYDLFFPGTVQFM